MICAKCGITFTRRSSRYCSLACSGAQSSNKKHGLARSPENVAWLDIKYRCNNPNSPFYSRYGGRGIKICERWEKFENFLADMGYRPPGTTLDRINNDGNYEPGNCRWTTRAVQNRNKSNVWPPADVEHMRYLLESGYSFVEVGKMMGKSKEAIATKASKCGFRSTRGPYGVRRRLPVVSREG